MRIRETDDRLIDAVAKASDAFFGSIADEYGLKSGDVEPLSSLQWDEVAIKHAKRFIEDNSRMSDDDFVKFEEYLSTATGLDRVHPEPCNFTLKASPEERIQHYIERKPECEFYPKPNSSEGLGLVVCYCNQKNGIVHLMGAPGCAYENKV